MTSLRIGGHVDAATHQRSDTAAAIPSEELTTHAVIVGMTGSGKTGLGVVLIEECLAAGVPALLIDPKGDLGNLALTFPDLGAADFLPWIDPGAAQRAGQAPEQFAQAQADAWRAGLQAWGLGPEQVRALHDGVDVTLYTPGAPHGVGLNIIGTLDVPADMSDPQAVQEEIDAYVTSLLNLVQIEADPLSSREHILLSTLVNDAWAHGRSLDLATLVASVQSPPVRKVGVLDLDTYYPPADRMKLALRLNGLLASPAFAAWLVGERIDIDAMLRTPDGRPRCAVISTAHLSDEQRQSVTAVVLAKLVTWMRGQPGTSDLRALLYMDEVAGYLPPTANPPTKAPILLLLKQARAFGVGVVLSTQNPVDLDYKALSNTGTWLIGRLQTEQDKARLVDGLTSAAGTIDPAAVSATISALGKREFVLKRASRDVVEVLTTRWAMSYLRGPLTREQVASLTAARTAPAIPSPTPPGDATPASAAPPPAQTAPAPGTPQGPVPATAAGAPGIPAPTRPLADDESPVAPRVAAGIPVHHLDPAASWAPAVGAVPGHRLVPGVIARVNLRYDDTPARIDHREEYEAVLVPVAALPSPAAFRAVDYDDRDLRPEPPPGAVYRLPPAEVGSRAWWTALQRDLTDHLVASRAVEVPVNRELKLFGRVGESTAQFADRCRTAAAEGADRAIAGLQSTYARKLAAAQRRLDTAQAALDRQRSARTTTMATDLLGGLFGGRRTSLSTAARRAGAAQGRVGAAEDKVDDLQQAVADLQSELDAESADIRAQWADRAAAVDLLRVPLERTDVSVASLGLVWIPVGT